MRPMKFTYTSIEYYSMRNHITYEILLQESNIRCLVKETVGFYKHNLFLIA